MNAAMIKRSAVALIAIAMAFGAFFGIQYAQALTSYDDIEAGDLIRGETFSAVYYMGADGFRYVFPNDKAYFTWYDDFDSVEWISDSDLARIQIGGNVTYKPGVRMVKITSDPKTYAVASGGVLMHVGSEALAVALYGASWNTMIDDVPDGFFTNYSVGDEIINAGDYIPSPQLTTPASIGNDKGLVAPEEIDITAAGFDPVCVGIEIDQGVRFTNTDTDKHSATADNLSWGTGTLTNGGSFIRVFDESGVYPFYDGYDSTNTGAVYVGAYADDCE